MPDRSVARGGLSDLSLAAPATALGYFDRSSVWTGFVFLDPLFSFQGLMGPGAGFCARESEGAWSLKTA